MKSLKKYRTGFRWRSRLTVIRLPYFITSTYDLILSEKDLSFVSDTVI